MKFMWIDGVSSKKIKTVDPVFIHFSFDDYKPGIMRLDGDKIVELKKKTYSVWRMVPPWEFSYFFTINGVPAIAEDLSKDVDRSYF